MIKRIELLAPGGDVDSIKAAIVAGADAIYCGLNKFNARNRAENISVDNLCAIISLAHANKSKIFITLNILILDSEFAALIKLLNKLVNTNIDGIIVQDLGLFYILQNHFKRLKVHASTQTTTHNIAQIEFLKKLGAERVNLSRELTLPEIKLLTAKAHENKILAEVFVHGSYCISFSGLCYMSSVHGANSGNRGRCSQPCRNEYLTTEVGESFPLNLKDNSAYLNAAELAKAGIDSLKIEGRIKKFHYVFTIVDAWQKQLQKVYEGDDINADDSQLYSVFNRDFSNGFLSGNMGKNMFIDNPRDNSAIHMANISGEANAENIEKAKHDIYNQRTNIIESVRKKISLLNSEKTPLQIYVSGKNAAPLKFLLQTPETTYTVTSEINLANNDSNLLNKSLLLTRLKSIDDTNYFIDSIDLSALEPNLHLPFKELTALKKQMLYLLNSKKEWIDPIDSPKIDRIKENIENTDLLFLISSVDDLYLANEPECEIYFQLPNNMQGQVNKYVTLFTQNPRLLPWFPSVLIGDNFTAACEILEQLKPKKLITNNSGIAYEAYKMGLNFIAGPNFNITNSFSLLALCENFSCNGAFISNELNKTQINGIMAPANFKLYYNMYHPIELMTSRLCLFQQITACEKTVMDEHCLSHCQKSASISDLRGQLFHINKQKGYYNKIYNNVNCLNTQIVSDMANIFSGFLIDLRDVKTQTKVNTNKVSLIKMFREFLSAKPNAAKKLDQSILPTINHQYLSKKGI